MILIKCYQKLRCGNRLGIELRTKRLPLIEQKEKSRERDEEFGLATHKIEHGVSSAIGPKGHLLQARLSLVHPDFVLALQLVSAISLLVATAISFMMVGS
eukprot:scaffold120662_cov59-Attheya_sp.AAC.2